MIHTRRLIAALLMAVPLAAHAWSGYNRVMISLLTVYQSGRGVQPGVLIEVPAGTPPDTEGCSQSGHNYAWIDFSTTTEPDGKALYAMALSAQTSGKQIGIGLNGCSTQGYPVVYGLNLYP